MHDRKYFAGLNGIILITLAILAWFIGLLSLGSFVTNIVLKIKYLKYNNMPQSQMVC